MHSATLCPVHTLPLPGSAHIHAPEHNVAAADQDALADYVSALGEIDGHPLLCRRGLPGRIVNRALNGVAIVCRWQAVEQLLRMAGPYAWCRKQTATGQSLRQSFSAGGGRKSCCVILPFVQGQKPLGAGGLPVEPSPRALYGAARTLYLFG